MADPQNPNNPNQPPKGTPPPVPPKPPVTPQTDTKQTIADLEQVKKKQGDYHDIIKDSIASLKTLTKQYDSIEGKLESLNEETLNLKEIQKIIGEATEKENIARKKLLQAERSLDEQGKIRVENYFKSSSQIKKLEEEQLERRKDISRQIITIGEQESKLSAEGKTRIEDYIKNEEKSLELTAKKSEAENDLKLVLEEINKLQESGTTDQKKLDSLLEQKKHKEDLISLANQDIDVNKKAMESSSKMLSNDEMSFMQNKKSLALKSESFQEKEKDLANLMQKNEIERDALSTTEAEVIGRREALKLAEESTKMAQKKLLSEKQIEKSTGLTGYLFDKLSQKLGIGDSVMGAMVKKARELQLEAETGGKKYGAFGTKLRTLGAGLKQVGSNIAQSLSDPVAIAAAAVGAFKLAEAGMNAIGGAAEKTGKFIGGLSKHTGTLVQDLTSGISGLLSSIPLVGGLLSGLVNGASAFIDMLLGVDNHIQQVGKSLGKSQSQMNGIVKSWGDLNMASGDVYANTDKMLDSYKELATQIGLNNELTREQLITDIKLKELGDYDLETRSKLVTLSNIQGTSQENIVKGVMAQTFALKKMTGIQLNNKQIIKELTSMSGYLGLEFAKYPEKLAKTLVVTKALGMDLHKLESIGDSMLDFESSMQAQFEAQLLTGKEINLTKARELFLNNDLAGAAAEITSQVGDSNEFLHMNRIAAESMAKAFGMSRDEMGNMLMEQEKMARAQKVFGADSVKNTEDLKDKVRLLIEQGDKANAIAVLGSEQAYNDEVRATSQEKLAAAIDKIKQSFVDMLTQSGLLEKLQTWVAYLTKPENIKGIIDSLKNGVADFMSFMGTVLGETMEFIGQLPGTDQAKWDKRAESVRNKMDSVSDSIRGMGASEAEKAIIKKKGQEKTEQRETESIKERASGPGITDYLRVTATYLNPIARLTDLLSGTNIVGSQLENFSKKQEDAKVAKQQALSKGIDINAKDYVIKTLPEDTVVGAGGTKLGRTDEMVKYLEKQNSLLEKFAEKSNNQKKPEDKIDAIKIEVPKLEPLKVDVPSIKLDLQNVVTQFMNATKEQTKVQESVANKSTETSKSTTVIDFSEIKDLFKQSIEKSASILVDLALISTNIANLITKNKFDGGAKENSPENQNLPSENIQKISSTIEQMKNSGGGLATKKEATNQESRYESITINNQMAQKEYDFASLTKAIESISINTKSSESPKPQVNITQDIKWDPITGPHIVTQVDQGGGDVSKFLNPVSGRG